MADRFLDARGLVCSEEADRKMTYEEKKKYQERSEAAGLKEDPISKSDKIERTVGMDIMDALALIDAHTSERMAKIAGRVLRIGHADPDDAVSLAGCVLRQYIDGKL